MRGTGFWKILVSCERDHEAGRIACRKNHAHIFIQMGMAVAPSTAGRSRSPLRSSSCALFSSSLRCASREKDRVPKFLPVKVQSQRVRVVDEHRAHRAQLFLFLFTKIQLKESYPKGTRRSRIRGQFDLKKIFEVAKREVIF